MSDALPPPKMAYAVVDHLGHPCFSGVTFERAAERVTALMHGECESGEFNPSTLFKIVRVEAE